MKKATTQKNLITDRITSGAMTTLLPPNPSGRMMRNSISVIIARNMASTPYCFETAMHSLGHVAPEEPRYPGIFVGGVFFVGHGGLVSGVGAHLVVASSKPS